MDMLLRIVLNKYPECLLLGVPRHCCLAQDSRVDCVENFTFVGRLSVVLPRC